MQLSKSEYMMYLKHPGWLWLKKHDKSKLPAVDDALQAMFDDGKLFEEYANQLFPDAVRIGFSFEENNYMSMPLRTTLAIKDGANVILQGRVEAYDITCIFDVIQKVGENEFDLYEIKSSTEVKEDHILDLAFQTVVLENAGLKMRKLFVIHVNKEYVRSGNIEVNQLIAQKEVTDEVKAKLDSTKIEIEKAVAIMRSSTPPDYSPRHVGLSALDEWMAIYEILFPQEHPHNIYKLTRISPKLIGELEDLGIKTIADIPDTVHLGVKQKNQVAATRNNERSIDKEKIREFISKIIYPLYFFDYETFSCVIPPFDKIHPHQQVPFQYSLHIKESPDGILTHKEFLHITNSNPCIHLLEKLKTDIGDTGTVFVWHESFEKGRNKELGEMFPEYKEVMGKLNDRVLDLKTPFSENWFVDKDFFGSASIKKVLPVLISELSYEKLDIKEGVTASRTWKELILDGKYADKKEEITQQLLEYCRMDTLAMVQLFKFLENEIM